MLAILSKINNLLRGCSKRLKTINVKQLKYNPSIHIFLSLILVVVLLISFPVKKGYDNSIHHDYRNYPSLLAVIESSEATHVVSIDVVEPVQDNRFEGYPPEPKEFNKTDSVMEHGDSDKGNGYYYHENNLWIPGIPTYQSQFLFMPMLFKGSVLPYAPNQMEGTASYNGLSLHDVKDGVALPFCSMIGSHVWIKRPYNVWEGPFEAVDCAGVQDIYNVVVHRREVVEIGFETATDWGMTELSHSDNPYSWHWIRRRVDNVIVSLIPPECLSEDLEPVNLTEWFLERVDFYKTFEDFENAYKPVYKAIERIPRWKMDLDGTYFSYDLNIFYDYCDPYWQRFLFEEE